MRKSDFENTTGSEGVFGEAVLIAAGQKSAGMHGVGVSIDGAVFTLWKCRSFSFLS